MTAGAGAMRDAISSLPSWVEPDPLRSRAIDALGLQQNADRIADVLVPGLSVLTTRARYFTFLAWARREAGQRAHEPHIHRLEAALAIREGLMSKTDPEHHDACRFIGSRNLSRRPELLDGVPKNPAQVYRVPAWRAYRASMVNLGLVDANHALTEIGKRTAAAFSKACRPDGSGKRILPPGACLSACSSSERRLLVEQLGVWKRGRIGKDGSDAGRRGALLREIESMFDGGFSVSAVLGRYERIRTKSPSVTVAALREAAIWERLSVGLTAVFLLWLHAIPRGKQRIAKILAGARRRRHAVVDLESISIKDEPADVAHRALASIRRALQRRREIGLDVVDGGDREAFDLGDALIGGRETIGTVMQRLEARHMRVKADEAWLRQGRAGVELARDPGDSWELPRAARLHPYRLSAFGQIIADLRGAR